VSPKNRLKAILRPVYYKLCRTYLRAQFGTREQLDLMERDWDNRARDNARHFIATGKDNWTDEEFFFSGDRTVADHILSDMGNICQGKSPDQMRVLEIGCGAGRVTRALAGMFGEVHRVDVSGGMVQEARLALKQ
jgi:2-polyprenyl-3-methyl-5-hydroxy-6-metoxy-1,4-benzoquinol methylase